MPISISEQSRRMHAAFPHLPYGRIAYILGTNANNVRLACNREAQRLAEEAKKRWHQPSRVAVRKMIAEGREFAVYDVQLAAGCSNECARQAVKQYREMGKVEAVREPSRGHAGIYRGRAASERAA